MLSRVFAYLSSAFYTLGYRFGGIATWLDNQGFPFYYLSPLFWRLLEISDAIGSFFYDAYQAARNIETVLGDAWSKAKQVFDYVFDVLSDRVNDVLNLAGRAWDYAYAAYRKAYDAWDYATGWLRDRANEAWSRAGNVWGSVTDWLKETAINAFNRATWAFEQIAAAVTAATQEIYAWVKGIPAEFKSFVDGVVATVKTWATSAIDDARASILSTLAAPFNLINLWFDDIQDFFNSPLDWLGSRFAEWFFGPDK